MDKCMKGVSVHTADDIIEIVQRQEDREPLDIISLYPEQVDLLISWLQEAKDEIQSKNE